ncbi:MAG: carbohydrate kinase [Chloroflexi bacterium]|nr:carbohydrate kinase [Chloroflexota bacterium]
MTARRRFTVVGLGELLWDELPAGRRLGGAPANVAYWAAQLGDAGHVASRVGVDRLGDEAVALLARAGVDTVAVQRDLVHPTGTVGVSLSAQGQPRYEIVKDVAWDHLAWPDAGWAALAARADAVCFGTLAQRAPAARAAIAGFLAATRPVTLRLLDLNLRDPFWSSALLDTALRQATAVKLNDDELPRVAAALTLPGRDEAATARALRARYALDLVCLTRGARGCLLITAAETVEEPGRPAVVADTVGAGDAFTAALLHHWLRGAPLARAAAAANTLGAWVATQTGGMPPPDPAVLRQVIGA